MLLESWNSRDAPADAMWCYGERYCARIIFLVLWRKIMRTQLSFSITWGYNVWWLGAFDICHRSGTYKGVDYIPRLSSTWLTRDVKCPKYGEGWSGLKTDIEPSFHPFESVYEITCDLVRYRALTSLIERTPTLIPFSCWTSFEHLHRALFLPRQIEYDTPLQCHSHSIITQKLFFSKGE
jgi:hypothetical protein